MKFTLREMRLEGMETKTVTIEIHDGPHRVGTIAYRDGAWAADLDRYSYTLEDLRQIVEELSRNIDEMKMERRMKA